PTAGSPAARPRTTPPSPPARPTGPGSTPAPGSTAPSPPPAEPSRERSGRRVDAARTAAPRGCQRHASGGPGRPGAGHEQQLKRVPDPADLYTADVYGEQG